MCIIRVGVRVGDCFGSIHVAEETMTSLYLVLFRKASWLVGGRFQLWYHHSPIEAGVGTELGNTIKKSSVSCQMARSQLGRRLKTSTWWTLIGELHKISIFTEKLVRALLVFDYLHLLTIEMFGDQIGFWSLGKG